MKSLQTLALVASIGLAPAALADRYRHHDRPFDFARVIHVDPIVEVYQKPVEAQACWDEAVQYNSPHRVNGGGAIAGAVVGGVIGHELGRGHGDRRVATAAGAIIGAALGGNAGRHGSHTSTVIEKHCKTTTRYVNEQRILGYRVDYVYAGNTYHTRMDHNPGQRLKVIVNVVPFE